nr:MAG TPA: hypothetical protein [Caudoviricetes sp.]
MTLSRKYDILILPRKIIIHPDKKVFRLYISDFFRIFTLSRFSFCVNCKIRKFSFFPQRSLYV